MALDNLKRKKRVELPIQNICSIILQLTMLMSLCGAPTYNLIRSLLHSNRPTSETFAKLVQIVKNCREPTPLESIVRFNFHTQIQKEREIIAQFVAELRRLAEHCKLEKH